MMIGGTSQKQSCIIPPQYRMRYSSTSLSSCSGIPEAFQFAVCMIQQYCCTLMIPRQYVKDTPVNNARTPGKLFLNECVWFDSPVDWGPKIFVDVRVTTNLHRKYFPRVLDDRGSHELVSVQVTSSQSSVSRQQCAGGSCFSTASARISRGRQMHGPSGSRQAVPLIYSSTVIVGLLFTASG